MNHFLIARISLTETNIIRNRAGKQIGLLGDKAHHRAPIIQIQCTQIDPVNENRTLRYIIKAWQKID